MSWLFSKVITSTNKLGSSCCWINSNKKFNEHVYFEPRSARDSFYVDKASKTKKALKMSAFKSLLRSGRDSNPRPPA
jgi:hypothetical protein